MWLKWFSGPHAQQSLLLGMLLVVPRGLDRCHLCCDNALFHFLIVHYRNARTTPSARVLL